jgi:hypothetical protein
MGTKTGKIIILDANTLYLASLRSFLLYMADNDFFQPKWTDLINKEWQRHLFEKFPDMVAVKLQRITDAMNNAFPDALVTGFESIIDSLALPDTNDRHVLAAAIKAGADYIVTQNTKDFPPVALAKYDLEAITPDEWIIRLLDLDSGAVLQSFHKQVNSLRKPPKATEEVLASLERCGLKKAVPVLRSLL